MQLRLILLALAFATATAVSDSCTPTFQACKGTCTTSNPAPKKGSDFTIDIKGSCPQQITSATFDIRLVFAGITLVDKQGVDASQENDFNLPLGSGSIKIAPIKFPTWRDPITNRLPEAQTVDLTLPEQFKGMTLPVEVAVRSAPTPVRHAPCDQTPCVCGRGYFLFMLLFMLFMQ